MHYLKPEGEAGETPGFFVAPILLSEHASVLVPRYGGCQAHLKMTVLQGQVRDGAGILVSATRWPSLEAGERLHQGLLIEDPVCSVLLENLSFFLDVLRGYYHAAKSN